MKLLHPSFHHHAPYFTGSKCEEKKPKHHVRKIDEKKICMNLQEIEPKKIQTMKKIRSSLHFTTYKIFAFICSLFDIYEW